VNVECDAGLSLFFFVGLARRVAFVERRLLGDFEALCLAHSKFGEFPLYDFGSLAKQILNFTIFLRMVFGKRQYDYLYITIFQKE
jgi:hypothetical protein